jgi:biotin carboxylase
MLIKQKHVLVVDAITPPQEALHELGYRITWIIRKHERRGPPTVADYNRCQNIFIYDEDTSQQNMVELAQLINKHDKIDAVAVFHDQAQLDALKIAETLQLPFALNKKAIIACTHKMHTRDKLQEQGLSQIRYRHVNNHQEIIEFFDNNPNLEKIIVKPFDGSGSQGIVALTRAHIVEMNSGTFDDQFQYPLLAEEFIEGKEYSVEGFTYKGEHHIIAITEKFKNNSTYIETGHLMPARLSQSAKEKISSYVKNCLTALGVNTGLSHTEVIMNEKNIALVETHTRGGGDRIGDLVKYTTGIDLYKLSALNAVSEEITPDLLTPTVEGKHGCIRFMIQDKSVGPIKSISGVEEIRNIPQVKDISLSFNVGEMLPKVVHSFDRAASVLTVCNDSEEALKIATDSIELIKFSF